jgi:ribose transport system substrate-binding protein
MRLIRHSHGSTSLGRVRSHQSTVRLFMTVATLGLATALASSCSSGTAPTTKQQTSNTSKQETSNSSAYNPYPGVKTIAEADTALKKLMAPTVWPTPTPLSKPESLKGKTIWWIPIAASIGVVNAIGLGVEDAVVAAGGNFHLCDGQANPTDIGACMQQAIQQHADAVLAGFIFYQQLPNEFNALTQAHIPVVIAGEAPPFGFTPSNMIAPYDITDSTFTFSANLAMAALAAHGAKTDALIMRSEDNPGLEAGTQEEITKYKQLCPACKYTVVNFTTPNATLITPNVTAALVKNPSINAITVGVDGWVPNIQQALATVGRHVDIFAVGGDLAEIQDVKAGTLTEDLGSPPNYAGWAQVNALMQLLAGDKVQPDTQPAVRWFDQANVQSLTLTPAAAVSWNWFGSDTYKQTYLNAWAGK